MTREDFYLAHYNGCLVNPIVDKIYDDFESRTCDNCVHRVFNYRSIDLIIDKCNIREQLHFNGSCDGLKCNKWVLK